MAEICDKHGVSFQRGQQCRRCEVEAAHESGRREGIEAAADHVYASAVATSKWDKGSGPGFLFNEADELRVLALSTPPPQAAEAPGYAPGQQPYLLEDVPGIAAPPAAPAREGSEVICGQCGYSFPARLEGTPTADQWRRALELLRDSIRHGEAHSMCHGSCCVRRREIFGFLMQFPREVGP